MTRTSRPLLGLLLSGVACAPQEQTPTTPDVGCDPRELAPGEVRIKRFDCGEEAINGGEGLTGDWILENRAARFVLRFGTGLTRFETAGGTVVDAARPGSRDGLREAIPLFETRDGSLVPLSEGTLELVQGADHAGIRVEGRYPDGEGWSDGGFSWTLHADTPTLELEGAAALELLPLTPAAVVGPLVEVDPDEDGAIEVLLHVDGDRTDLGGALVHRDATALTLGTRGTVAGVAWPDGVAVSGDSDGDWVEARDAEGGTLARLPVEGLRFTGTVPRETAALVPVGAGVREGLPVEPGLDRLAPVGPTGGLRLSVVDDAGAPIAATVHWLGADWPAPVGGGELPLPPGLDTLVVSAGSAYEVATFPEQRILGWPSLEVRLTRVFPEDTTTAALAERVAPDRQTRRTSREAITAVAARGAGIVVTTAHDEVGELVLPTELARRMVAWAGTTADADGIQVGAWPFSRASRRPAHGAAPWPTLTPDELLAYLARSGRQSWVNAAFVDAAGPVWSWPRLPTGLWLDDLDDLPALFTLLDAGFAGPPLAATTHLRGFPADLLNAAEAEQMLRFGPASAGNGPLVELEVVYEDADGATTRRPQALVVRCTAPTWMPLSAVDLWGPGGARLASFPAEHAAPPQVHAVVEPPDATWVVATCAGETSAPPMLDDAPWAVSSPVWLERP